jgi:hypothetical protein
MDKNFGPGVIGGVMLVDPQSGQAYKAGAGSGSSGASGTQDVNVKNASLPISGSVTVSNASLAINDNGGSITIDGDVRLTNTSLAVTDNGGSLTVDGTVNIGNSSIAVTDGNGSLTVDGAVSVSNAAFSTAAPAGTESGLIVRNVPSGTQTVAISGTPTVAVSGTPASAPATLSTTSSALTPYRNPALTNTASTVKASAGRMHYFDFYNSNTAAVHVHFYNALIANVTVGTTTPVWSTVVPAGASRSDYLPNSLNFSTGIALAATTGPAVATAPTNAIMANVAYI